MFRRNTRITELGWVRNATIFVMVGYAWACSNSETKFGAGTNLTSMKYTVDMSGNNDMSGKKAIASEALGASQTSSSFASTKNFISSKINDGSVDLNLLTNESRMTLTMERIPGGEVTFIQPDRLDMEKNFNQIVNVTSQSQAFMQEDVGLVDVLVVVDDSGSMKTFQDRLAPQLAPLISEIATKNWRVGVTTTSYSSVKQKFRTFNRGETNVNSQFESYVKSLGTAGDGDERGINQAIWGLERPGFLRDGSSIAVLIVSDEKNCESLKCGENQVQSLLNKFDSLGRAIGSKAKVYSIIVPQVVSECTGLNQAADHGADYMALSEATGGVVGRICDLDYKPILSQMSRDIASLYMSQFSLSQVPQTISSLQMTVGNTTTEVNAADYQVVGQNLVFKMIPPANSTFIVRFESLASPLPLNTSFDLGEAPYSGSLKVYVNNVESSGFNLVGSKIEFLASNVPPSGSFIKATFKKNQDLNRTFTLDAGSRTDIDPSSLVATVSGQSLPFTRNGLSIIFENPPQPGSTISVKYELAKLVYDFSPGAIVSGSLKAVDQAENALNPIFEANKLKFDMAEFQNQRVIILTYKPELSTVSNKIELPHLPLNGKVELKGTVNGVCPTGNLTVTDKSVSIGCQMTKETGINVTYQYLSEIQSSFSVADVLGCENSLYQVFINQLPFTDFKASGCVVTPNSKLANGSSVKIIVIPQ